MFELDGLVDEILLASRLDTVATNEVREEIDLLALAAEESARYDEVQLEGEHVKVQGDPRLLRRLLRNLLENAKRHGVPPTQIRLQREGNMAVLKVWDNGPGPAAAEFEQVFTPFYRRRDSHNSTGNGLGSIFGTANSPPPRWRCPLRPLGRRAQLLYRHASERWRRMKRRGRATAIFRAYSGPAMPRG